MVSFVEIKYLKKIQGGWRLETLACICGASKKSNHIAVVIGRMSLYAFPTEALSSLY